MNNNGNIAKGIFWKLLERFGVLGGQFVLQVVLARLLDPSDYGTLSLMVIFTSLANAFIQHGFNTALVQNKDVTDADYSSVFWVNLGITSILYAAFFIAAPVIATFYEAPEIVWPFRVLCLMLFPGALNSVQIARCRKSLDFKTIFKCNVVGIALSGIAGIVLAYMGAGLWALVIQNVLNVTVSCIVLWFAVDFRPHLIFDFSRVKTLFSFGWKLTVSNLLDTLYADVRSMIIGVKYNADVLGYYDRGKQFPQFLNSAINSTVQSVLLPAMAAEQDDTSKVKALMRRSVTLCSYIVFPMMAGLAGVATPLVRLLLTEKWLPCVPYLQIYCFTFAFYPVHTSNLQAINAMGRSDIFLKLELIKKAVGLALLTVAVYCFDSPVAIAMTGVVSAFSSSFINAYPNKKLIRYSYLEQIKDILPSLAVSVVMLIGVLSVELLAFPDIVTLALQVIVGAVLYVVISAALRLEPFLTLLDMVQTLRSERKRVIQ